MKKKISMTVIMCLIAIGSIVTVNAATTSASCTLRIGNVSAKSSSVGVSRKGEYNIKTYATSKAPTNAAVYAAWVGWPYTLESNKVVAIGKQWSGIEQQSKDSTFKITLWAMYNNNTYAYGSIKAL